MCVLRNCPGNTRLHYSFSRFAVRRCERCGLMYRHPFPTAEERVELYADPLYHQSEYFRTNIDRKSPERRIFNRCLDWLGRASAEESISPETLLDVGCGAGTFLRLARRRGWSVEGVELSSDLASRARDEFELDVSVGDVLNAQLKRSHYDVITMWESLEHATDPEAALTRVKHLLSPGGRVVVFTLDRANLINAIGRVAYRATFGRWTTPAESLHDVRQNFFFTERSLTRLLRSAGFGIGHAERYRAYAGRWSGEPAARLRVAGSAAVDFASFALGMPYRRLLYCRPVA